MNEAGFFIHIRAKYEARFLKRHENDSDREISHTKATSRKRFSVAGAIFPTEPAWPRNHY